ncbi:uncharacterized protein IWZ02DRAFT_462213 [Phyllosticta citriasiana]|uniref:Uncharacterized protein n=1 Tax=Phyllosticta citriasiana TaxID=595635 RepID=A0ABR1L4Y3_9PEZI
MGRPVPPPVFRDDPDAVSMHTTRSNYEYDDTPQIGDQLPAYFDHEGSVSKSNIPGQGRVSQLPEDEYSVIECGNTQYAFGKPVNTKAVTFRIDERLRDPSCLFKYISDVLTVLPPKPLVHVHGYHWQTMRKGNKKEKKQVVDFDIKLNMQSYLGEPTNEWCKPRTVSSTEKALRGGFRKTVAKDPNGDLEVGDLRQDLFEWCKEYCNSNRMLKSFRINRTVSGLDTNLIHQRIEALIRQTNYRGHILITFPIEDRGIDIYNPHRINHWRTTPWIRWLFYLSFLWLFTWPLLYFFTARWAIYTIDWPFSVPMSQSPSSSGRDNRKWATVSEEAWFLKHRKLIRRLVLSGHQGGADGMDLDEDYEELRAFSGRSGNEHVDTAVGIIQAGVAGWNAVQRGLGRDLDGWGADC